jgi:hypothetical protein
MKMQRGWKHLLASIVTLGICVLIWASSPAAETGELLRTQLLVTWYGNPRSPAMGVLGESSGNVRADALRRQAAAFADVSTKRIVPAYHLVAVVAQRTPGGDAKCRRRETPDVIRSTLAEAREHDFKLVLDVQPGRSDVAGEVEYLSPFLAEPDVFLALDPEYGMGPGQVPGCQVGHMDAAAVNSAIDVLERVIITNSLPPKVLIIHQFTLAMLPDKQRIRRSSKIDLVLNMDGFGSQALKLASYRAIMRQHALEFAGIKLFYKLDRSLFTPAQIMALSPTPSVVIYQ